MLFCIYMYMYMYVYVYRRCVCRYIYVYTYMYVYIDIVCIYVSMYIHVCMYIHVYVYRLCLYVHIYVYTYMYMYTDIICIYIYMYVCIHARVYIHIDRFPGPKCLQNAWYCIYGVSTIGRLLEITGLFGKRVLQKSRYSAKGTYDFKEPTNRSHSISKVYRVVAWVCHFGDKDVPAVHGFMEILKTQLYSHSV